MPHRKPLFPPLIILIVAAGSIMSPAFAGVPPVAANAAALKAATRDAVVEDLPGGYAALFPEPFAKPASATDPRYGWKFSRATYVYAPTSSGGSGGDARTSLALVVRLHHEPEDLVRARQTTRLVARLLHLYHDHFGRDATFPRDADIADVWLAAETPPNALEAGGETRDNQLYLFATGAPRLQIEWVRTIAHEWGHLTMPAARGFTLPEYDAGGYLGERLYIKWLREERPAAAVDDGVTRGGLDLYWVRQIAPLMDHFAQAGPNAAAFGGDGSDAMDLYIGGVLSSDAAFGSTLTGRALHTIEGERPRDFFDSLRRVVSAFTWGAPLPVRLPAWVPLERGRYTVNGSATLRIAAPTWRYLTAPAQATLRRSPLKREALAR